MKKANAEAFAFLWDSYNKTIFARVQLLCLAANAFIKATRASTPAKGMAL